MNPSEMTDEQKAAYGFVKISNRDYKALGLHKRGKVVYRKLRERKWIAITNIVGLEDPTQYKIYKGGCNTTLISLLPRQGYPPRATGYVYNGYRVIKGG
jgi:hypothetical protein